jgi:Bacterial Ig-like domain (group 3)
LKSNQNSKTGVVISCSKNYGEPYSVLAPFGQFFLRRRTPASMAGTSDRERFTGSKTNPSRGRNMKLQSSMLRNSLLGVVSLLFLAIFAGPAASQDTSSQQNNEATRAKFPAAKAQTSAPADADADANVEREKSPKAEKDSPDAIRKRDAWFYKRRASANGHIPAGARAQALAHRDRMMEAEGKLIHRPDGSIAEVAAPPSSALASPVTSTWTSVGPTPTTGGFFSPVTGRITAIAVDPSDSSGSTVLTGGAQGGIWRTIDAGNTWAEMGDQNPSLAMGSIAFANPASPGGAGLVYAGTGEQASIGFDIYYGAGVLKSTNNGQTWAPTCTPNTTTCPFVGPFNNASVFGFFSLGGARISYIAVNPTNPQLVLAGVQFALSGNQEGVYCSADGGATWSNVLPGQMSTFVGFASATVAFAALGDPFGSNSSGTGTNPNGIYKSINASACSMTFSALATGLPAASTIGRVDMGISPNFATDNTVYASISNATTFSDTNLGVWVTTNGGTSWTQQTTAPDVCQQQCWYDNVIKVDPNNGKIAYLGGAAVGNALGNPGYLVRTTDGGNSWASVLPTTSSAALLHVDQHAIAFVKPTTGTDAGNVRAYVGNDGGIWRTDNAEAATVSWNNLNDSTLTLSQFYPSISMNVSSPQIAYGGTQDNGSQDFVGPSTTWTDNGLCGDGASTAVDGVIPSTVYIACGTGTLINVSYQNAAANSFFDGTNGINLADSMDFIAPIAADPSTANVAYFGTTKIYQTVNGANSWTALTPDLLAGGNSEDNFIAIAVAPTNPAVVYAGSFGGEVFVATNVTAGAGTFNAVTGQASLPTRAVTGIAVDPADTSGKTAYVAMSGFSFVNAGAGINDPKGHIFKTTDGGATFTDVSCTVANCQTPNPTDLPNTPVNDIVVDPDIPGTLYAATDVGVFQGTCTTTAPFSCTWATLSTGLPRVAVLSLRLHEPSRTLLAATHGRGVWSIVMNNFTAPGPHIASLSAVAATAGSPGFTLTVNGNGLTGGTIQFGGTALATTPVSDSQLTGNVLATSLTGAGVVKVSVTVGTTPSNALPFAVLGGPPTITASSPPSVSVGTTTATTLTVTGTNFTSSSQVLMNPDVGGTPIQTTFVSATQLTASLPTSFIGGFGSTNSVGVRNPPPGGGTTVTTQTVTLPTFVVVAPAPSNDNFVNAMVVTPGANGSFTDTKDSSGATTQSSDPIPTCSQSAQIPFATGISNTIWYKFTPTSSGTITDVDTIGSSYDTVLSIYTGSQSSLTQVACNDDIISGIDIQSQITNLPVTSGTTYFIMVSSFGPADPNPLALGGKSVFNLTFASNSATGNFTIGATDVSPSPVTAGNSGTSMITVTPGAGATGTQNVNVTCSVLPPGVTCTPNPLAISVTGSTAGSQQLTVAVAAPAAQNATASVTPEERNVYAAGIVPTRGGKGWWMLSTGAGLAAIILLLLPGRKRYRAAFTLGLICAVSFVIGCGGGSSGGGGGGGGGPVATTTQIKVTSATKGGPGTMFTFTATVTGGTPTDMVQLLDNGVATGAAVAVSGGTATLTTAALSTVGTHSITGHYLGDSTNTQASSSGPLNVTITGSATVTIQASPVATNGSPTINLTIN